MFRSACPRIVVAACCIIYPDSAGGASTQFFRKRGNREGSSLTFQRWVHITECLPPGGKTPVIAVDVISNAVRCLRRCLYYFVNVSVLLGPQVLRAAPKAAKARTHSMAGTDASKSVSASDRAVASSSSVEPNAGGGRSTSDLESVFARLEEEEERAEKQG